MNGTVVEQIGVNIIIRKNTMGLLPIIISALTIFTILVVLIIVISYLSYKLRSKKVKPYLQNNKLETVPVPVSVRQIQYEAPKNNQNNYYQASVTPVVEAPRPVRQSRPVVRIENNTSRFQLLNPVASFRYDGRLV